MSDINIIAAVLDSRAAYDSVEGRVDTAALSPQAQVWWTAIVEWYKRDPAATAVERAMLRERVKRDLNPKHVEALVGWYDDVPPSVSPGNVVSEVIAVQRQAKGFEVQSAIAANESPDNINKLMDEMGALLREERGGGTPTFTVTSTEEIMLDEELGERIPLAPDSLNRRVNGGAVRGSHILIFGRPESGKTLLTINMVSGFLKGGYSVLYIGNEEPTTRTNVRLIGSMMARTIQQVEKNMQKALKYVTDQGWWTRYRSVQMTPGTIREIEDAISYFKPDVVVLDQIRNVQSGGQKLTNRLEDNAMGFRGLLSKYNCLGVSVTQAGDKTERHGQEVPAILSMSDVDSSRTGLPGQCDLMLGVGVTEELFAHGKRMISLAKNKLSTERTPFLVDVDLERTLIR